MGAVVREYLYLLEHSFAQPPSPDGDTTSVLGNLQSVPREAWDWLPAGAERSIRDIVLHIGGCKYIYDDHAFRTASLAWDRAPVVPSGWREMSPSELLDWMRTGHDLLAGSLKSLNDRDLDRPCEAPWGAVTSAREVARAMMHHDTYHAGEINHIRSLFQRNDRWAFLD